MKKSNWREELGAPSAVKKVVLEFKSPEVKVDGANDIKTFKRTKVKTNKYVDFAKRAFSVVSPFIKRNPASAAITTFFANPEPLGDATLEGNPEVVKNLKKKEIKVGNEVLTVKPVEKKNFIKPEIKPIPVKEPIKEPVKEPIKEPIKEPVKEPIKEPVKEPIKEPKPESEKIIKTKEIPVTTIVGTKIKTKNELDTKTKKDKTKVSTLVATKRVKGLRMPRLPKFNNTHNVGLTKNPQ